MSDNELPGMWQESDLSGGEADGYSNAHTHRDRYPHSRAEKISHPSGDDGGDGMAWVPDDRRLPVRKADAAQYEREPIPAEQRGQIRVRLLNALPDPYGSVAALCAQYTGKVVRSLSEVSDEERRSVIDDMLSTVLNGPLEVAQFHWQIEGVTRSITHQMVRSRASFFAQESLRFAVPEGAWEDEVPLPPSLAGADPDGDSDASIALRRWRTQMAATADAYAELIARGVPAEEARGVLPHDMPTRIHWVCDLRTLLQEAGKRTCTQAQFPWRVIFAGMANALREYGTGPMWEPAWANDHWQFEDIANRLRPVCFQTGSCGFMAKFDRNCSIRERVDAFAQHRIKPDKWGTAQVTITKPMEDPKVLGPIHDYEWAANPAAARS